LGTPTFEVPKKKRDITKEVKTMNQPNIQDEYKDYVLKMYIHDIGQGLPVLKNVVKVTADNVTGPNEQVLRGIAQRIEEIRDELEQHWETIIDIASQTTQRPQP
jgi:iron-sulfur cluster repair protein YtfE (RIC family)